MKALSRFILCALFTLMAASSARAQFVVYSNQPYGINPYGFNTFGASPFNTYGASPFGLNTYGASPFGTSGTSPFGTYGASPFGTFGTFAADGGLGGSTFTTLGAPTTFTTYSVRPLGFNNVQFSRFRNQLPATTLVVPNQPGAGQNALVKIQNDISNLRTDVNKLQAEVLILQKPKPEGDPPQTPRAPSAPGLSVPGGSSGGTSPQGTLAAPAPRPANAGGGSTGSKPAEERIASSSSAEALANKSREIAIRHLRAKHEIEISTRVMKVLEQEGRKDSWGYLMAQKELKVFQDEADRLCDELLKLHSPLNK